MPTILELFQNSTVSSQVETGEVTIVSQEQDGIRKQSKLDIPCLLYTSPSPRDKRQSRMPSSA